MGVLSAFTVSALLSIHLLTDVVVTTGENASDGEGAASIAWKVNLYQLPSEVQNDLHFGDDSRTVIILPQCNGTKVHTADGSEQVDREAACLHVTERSVPDLSTSAPTDTPTSASPPAVPDTCTIEGTGTGVVAIAVVSVMASCGVLCILKRRWIWDTLRSCAAQLRHPKPSQASVQDTGSPPTVERENRWEIGGVDQASSASPHNSAKVDQPQESDCSFKFALPVGKKQRKENASSMWLSPPHDSCPRPAPFRVVQISQQRRAAMMNYQLMRASVYLLKSQMQSDVMIQRDCWHFEPEL